jgi:phage-related protein
MADTRKVEFDFSGSAEKLIKTLERIEQHIRRVPESKKVDISAKTAQARKELDAFMAELRAASEQSPEITVQLNLKRMAVDVARAKAMVASLPERRTITIRARETAFGRLANAARLVQGAADGAEKALTTLGQSSQNAEKAMEGLTSIGSHLSTFLRRLGPLMAGLGIAVAASLLPAIIALGEAFVGAAAGAGALATALGTALVPGVIAAIGIMGRFNAVMDVLKSKQAADDAAKKASQKAAEGATAEEEALTNARRAAADASRRVVQAEEDLAEARKKAREDIANAEQRQIDAQRRVADATRALADAEVRSYRQIRDAVEAASDAIRDYEHAQLSVAQSKLNTKRAVQELKNLRKQTGLISTDFDDLFKKFTDVNVPLDDLAPALKKAAQQAGGISGTDQLDIEQAILDVREAKLNEKDATDQLSDANRNMNDTQQDAAKLKEQGVHGTDTYRTAVENLESAQRDATEAQKDYNELLKKGVEGADGVVAAHEALGDAIRNEKRQLADLKDARKKAAEGDQAAKDAMDEYRRKREELTGAEKNFLDAVVKFQAAWKTLWKGASQPVIDAVAKITDTLAGALPFLAVPMQQLSESWGKAIDNFVSKVSSLQNLGNLAVGLEGLKTISEDLGDILGNVVNTFLNLGNAAMPFLQDMFKDLKKVTGAWSDQTSDIEGVRKKIAPMVRMFKLFVGIVAAVGDALLSVFSAGAAPIEDFVKWILKGIKGFAKWSKSADGQKKIKQFFEDTLPLAKSLIKFIIGFGKIILKAFQFIAPVIKPAIDSINDFLDIGNFILDLLLKIPTPVRTALGWLVTFGFAFLKIGKFAKGAAEFIGKFPSIAEAVVGLLKGIGSKIVTPFREAWNGIKSLFSLVNFRTLFGGIGSFLRGALTTVKNIIVAPFRAAWTTIKRIFTSGKTSVGTVINGLVDIFKGVVSKLKPVWEALKSGFRSAVAGVKKIFDGFKKVIEGAINTVTTTVKSVVNILVDGMNLVIRGLNKIHFKIPDWVPKVGGKEWGINIPEVPHMAKGGIATGTVVAMIGEAGREAVLPLSAAVYKELATGIVNAMQTIVAPRQPGVAAATAGGGGVTIEQQTVILPPAPGHDQMGDTRHQAVQFAREMSRRGGSSVGH